MKTDATCSIGECERGVFARGWCRAHYMRWRRYGDPLTVKNRPGKRCEIDGCDRPHYAHGWCHAHYRRKRLYDDPLGGGPERQPRTEECSIDECGQPVRARGWCMNHYGRWKRNGDPLGGKPSPGIRAGDGSCIVDGCPSTAATRGWCDKHYYRWQRYGDPLDVRDRRHKAEWVKCAVDGCEEWATTRGWCPPHYQRWKLYGNPEEPLRRARSGEGHRGINNNGYVVLRRGGETILEHRQVMEQILGRKMLPGETVHHLNGIKTDNRPENLELWVSTRAGQRVADLVAFVVEHYRAEVESKLAH